MTKNRVKLSKADYHAILKAMPDLYLILNPALEIVEASDAYVQATMMQRETAIGRSIFDVFPDNPDDPTATGTKNLRESLERVLHGKKTDPMAVQKYDVRIPDSPGGIFEERYWSPVNTPVLGSNQDVIYIIHRVVDVTEFIRLKQIGTEQEKLTQNMRESAGKMESEIINRAQEIQEINKELRAARKMADEANQAKSAFLATMSHEIRTPLNGVIGMTSLMKKTPLSDEQQEYANAIHLSGETLLALINDILDFSKIESGHFELDRIDFDLHQVVEDAVEIVAPRAHEKNLAIGSLFNLDVPAWITTDPARLTQVLINLLGNAVKFTASGQVELKISMSHESSRKKNPDDYVLRFEVIDSGIGITTKMMKNLFTSFSQGDASVSRKYGGTGLGLAISKRLVEFMGGKIGVHSKPGIGSCFWFTIRAQRVKTDVPKLVNFFSEQFKNLRVLVVDDKDINRQIIELQTNAWGMRCDGVDNGFSALEKLMDACSRGEPYGLVLIDYFMPGLDGLSLAKQIYDKPELRSTPLLMLTSLGLPVDREKLQQLHIVNCLTKPVRQSKLYENIVNALQKKDHAHYEPNFQACEVTEQACHPNRNTAILLVEDYPVNQQVAQRMLTVLGCPHVDLANNGIEAIAAYTNTRYDLILMDCQMPEMDGYTATKKIRELEANNQSEHVPIIAMTAHAMKGDKELCLAAGMDDYISKPINFNTLGHLLERWLVNTTGEFAVVDEVPHAKETSVILDIPRLELLFGQDKPGLKAYIMLLSSSIAAQLTALSDAIDKKDWTMMSSINHKLKGAVGNGGAEELYNLVLRQEAAIKAHHHNEVSAIQAQLHKAFERFEAYLLTL